MNLFNRLSDFLFLPRYFPSSGLSLLVIVNIYTGILCHENSNKERRIERMNKRTNKRQADGCERIQWHRECVCYIIPNYAIKITVRSYSDSPKWFKYITKVLLRKTQEACIEKTKRSRSTSENNGHSDEATHGCVHSVLLHSLNIK